jgi:hypothetical protein
MFARSNHRPDYINQLTNYRLGPWTKELLRHQSLTGVFVMGWCGNFVGSEYEPELLNFSGAQESIPRNQFRQAV